MLDTLLLACIIILQLVTIGFLYMLSKKRIKESLSSQVRVRSGRSYGKTLATTQELQRTVSSPLDYTTSYY